MKKKTYIGWTFEDWKQLLGFPNNCNTMDYPTIFLKIPDYVMFSRDKYKKVQITIEEVK